MRNYNLLLVAFIIAYFIALIYSQEIIHVDIEDDMQNESRWNLRCENGYANFSTDYNSEECQGGIDIPEEERSGQVGFWTSCSRWICEIAYTVQPDDVSFAIRIHQNKLEARIWIDDQIEFINGSGLIDTKWDIRGKGSVLVWLNHFDANYYAVMDKIAINADLPPITNPSTEEPSSPPTEGPTTTPRPPHLCPVDDPMEPPNDKCDPDEPFPTYLPYPYDCAKYFQCSNGMAICQRCANGTIWSQAETVCVRNGTIPCDPPTTTPRPVVINEYSIVNFLKKFFF